MVKRNIIEQDKKTAEYGCNKEKYESQIKRPHSAICRELPEPCDGSNAEYYQNNVNKPHDIRFFKSQAILYRYLENMKIESLSSDSSKKRLSLY
jgi:hypothetical protein